MYLFNLKSILWNFLKLCLIIIQLHHYIIIIRLREEKKKRKKKNSVPLPRYFFPIPSNECPVSMKFYGNVFTGGVATPCESTSFATLPRIAHVLFSNSAAIQSTVSYHREAFSLCCAMPRTYDLDMTIRWNRSGNSSIHRRTIGKNKDDNAWCTHDLVTDIFAQYFHFDLVCTFTLYSTFFFLFFYFKLEFLHVENCNS